MSTPLSPIPPKATIQIDIDSFSVINKAYNFNVEMPPLPINAPDPIISHTVPIYLALFKEFKIQATFFIVGRDLENEHNIPFFFKILKAGHEIANHSYIHNEFDLLPPERIENDITKCHNMLHALLGITCRGFKAPCYALTSDLLNILRKMNYAYDSSMISTILSPVIKTYYYLLLGKRIHPANWGYLPHLLSPVAPYHPSIVKIWQKNRKTITPSDIIELPVTTLPYFKIPIHFSFIITMGFRLFKLFINLARATERPYLNFAFHAADLMPHDALPASFYQRPGVGRSLPFRIQQAKRILKFISEDYAVYRSFDLAQKYR